jgi:hypothetical protein
MIEKPGRQSLSSAFSCEGLTNLLHRYSEGNLMDGEFLASFL